ncbi:MAG: 4Fe-4S binding protein [Spirochaetaceae bacterium]|nr:4Fe-4S binding protein [Spirochaetaceae bacterium]
MNSPHPIYTESTECQDCYKCIRRCPVKAIRVENGHAKIIPDSCIFCGACVIHCPSHAKHSRDDTARAKHLINQKERVVVSLAPSFISEFSDYTPAQLIAAIKCLGFSDVSETAIGADLVSAQVAQDLAFALKNPEAQKLFISSACPAVVEYIKHYMPELDKYITDRASPLLAHSRYLRKLYGDDIGIVFIGPCIAKKREADVWKEVDLALTFTELRQWLEAEGIRADTAVPFGKENEQVFVPFKAAKSSLYPVDGGMIAAFKEYDTLDGIRTMTVSGINEIHHALDGLEIEKITSPIFMELLSCAGGCINGPGTSAFSSGAMRRLLVEEYAAAADSVASKELLSTEVSLVDTLPIKKAPSATYTEEEIRSALRSVGKYSVADEMNCASCGYDTCRAFAAAILDNRAEKTMCVSYMRKLAQKKANGLIRAIPSGVVIADKNLKIVECNMNFAKLLGHDVVEMYEAKPGLEGADLNKLTSAARFFSDVLSLNGPDVIDRDVREGKKIFHVTVFEIEKEEIAAGVIEDITAPQSQKSRTISQARKIIDKNLSVVQKIAFLLGENAAETESMLNSIIDSYATDEESEE